jgi:hypothetical protein
MRERNRTYSSKTQKSAQKGRKTLKKHVKDMSKACKVIRLTSDTQKHEMTRKNTFRRGEERERSNVEETVLKQREKQ